MTVTATKPFVKQITIEGEGCLGYIVADEDSKEAAIIDPRHDLVETFLDELKAKNLKLKIVLDTHTHADHLSGAADIAKATGAEYGMLKGTLVEPANRALTDGEIIKLGETELKVLETPGHTPDSLTFHVEGHLFTGDTMLIGGSGRTDFMGGDAVALFESFEKFKELPGDTIVWPGHDYDGNSNSTLAKERESNFIYTAGGKEKVVEKLSVRGPLPQGMAEILTFNRKGTAPGVNLDIHTIHEMMKDEGSVQIVDVRSAVEFSGEHIEGSWNIPLDELEPRIVELNAAKGQVIVTCSTGNRSVMAAQILERRGFRNYKMMQGGVHRWIKEKLPHKAGRRVWPMFRQTNLGAGIIVLGGLALGTFVNPWLYLVAAFAGVGLSMAGLTGWCLQAQVLALMPWNRAPAPTTGGGTSGSCSAGGMASGSVAARGGGCGVGGGSMKVGG